MVGERPASDVGGVGATSGGGGGVDAAFSTAAAAVAVAAAAAAAAAAALVRRVGASSSPMQALMSSLAFSEHLRLDGLCDAAPAALAAGTASRASVGV